MKPRKPVDQLYGGMIRSRLEVELPTYATCSLDAALSGDRLAAESLCSAAPNKWRGWVAMAAYYLGTPNPAYQAIIREVWNHDHQHLLAVAATRAVIRRMMASAEFDYPFSGTVTVFRGGAGVNLKAAAQGLSWTVSRDIACWFARRSAKGGIEPIVLTANIASSEIVFWDDSRSEQEVVLKRVPITALDSNQETWAQAADRHAKVIEGLFNTKMRLLKSRRQKLESKQVAAL